MIKLASSTRVRICSTTFRSIDEALGRKPILRTGIQCGRALKTYCCVKMGRVGRRTERSLFRSVLTQKDPNGEPVALGANDSGYEPDPALRDFENVPLKDDVDTYFEREVHPYVPDGWMDRAKDTIGYEINFNQHFYKYTPPRTLEAIDAELKQTESEIQRLVRMVVE